MIKNVCSFSQLLTQAAQVLKISHFRFRTHDIEKIDLSRKEKFEKRYE